MPNNKDKVYCHECCYHNFCKIWIEYIEENSLLKNDFLNNKPRLRDFHKIENCTIIKKEREYKKTKIVPTSWDDNSNPLEDIKNFIKKELEYANKRKSN